MKITCVSHNNPFAGKRMGRHISVKHQYQTAFIVIKNLSGQKFCTAIC